MGDKFADAFKSSLADGLANRTLSSCSRWASRRRIMSGDFAGNYSDKYHPWVRAMHDAQTPYVWVMKGAQLGVTEVAINRALYTLDVLKRDVLYVLPTLTGATDFSKARLGGALALSPYLRSIFSDVNSVGLKQAGSNTLYIRGSRGKDSLVSVPVSELILDEVDRMKQELVWLALERLSGQLTNKNFWGISTPTVPDFGIHLLYSGSTQEHFIFPCPACSRLIEFKWPDSVEIVGEHATDARCHESFLKCSECKAKLDQRAKPDFLGRAYWESFDKNANPLNRGFHISQLYSFTQTAGDLVVAHFRGFGNDLAEKEFFNSKLGLPHISHGAKVTETMVQATVRDHSMDDLRPKAAGRLICLGVDRGLWNHWEVTEYFLHDGWSLDVNARSDAKVLAVGKFHEEHFDRFMDELMRDWQVLMCVLDADPGVTEARRFARRYPGFVHLCRYRRGQTGKEISVDNQDDGSPMATVDRSSWLAAALSRFKTDPPRITLPRDIPSEYQQHIMSLVSTYTPDEFGNPVLTFVKTGTCGDHWAHARTYNEMALPLVGARDLAVDIKSLR